MTLELDARAQEMRERLGSGFFALARAAAGTSGVHLRTPAELEGTLADILQGHPGGSDLHVFGYGSLMWNPALLHAGQCRARVHGWHRSFCLRSLVGRGAPETPGLMLALERGGSCNGTLIRIPADRVPGELALLWRREMTWGSYDARWVRAWTDSGPLRAVTFVARRCCERYVRDLPVHEAARLIATGRGGLGSCRAYFDDTLAKLRELGIRDERMEHLDAVLRAA